MKRPRGSVSSITKLKISKYVLVKYEDAWDRDEKYYLLLYYIILMKPCLLLTLTSVYECMYVSSGVG